jgi:hypothetical protein
MASLLDLYIGEKRGAIAPVEKTNKNNFGDVARWWTNPTPGSRVSARRITYLTR